MNVGEIELTAADIGRVFGISERRVRELRDQGTIPSGARGKFNLVAAGNAYFALLRPVTGRAASGGSGEAVSFDEARVRLLTEQADGQALRNAVTRGDLIDQDTAEAAFAAVLDSVRTRYLAVPTKAAPLLLGRTDPADVFRILTELIHEALRDLSVVEFQVVDGELVKRSRKPNGSGHV